MKFNSHLNLSNICSDLSKFIANIYSKNFLVLLISTFAIGIFVRIIPLILLGFPQEIPFNGGGLYYAFSTAIIENNFQYPVNIPYYSSFGVPFAYNPLVFYLIALIATLLKISPFILHIYLPTVFSIIAIFLFYVASNQLFDNKNIVIASTFFYCILPLSFSELLPGEGLIESFGTMAYLFGLISLFQIYKGGGFKYVILSGIIFGLITLGSPGGALAFAITLVIVSLFKENLKSAIKTIFTVSIIGAIVSAPWWASVIYYHGFNTILNGILIKGGSFLGYLVRLVYFNAGCGWLFGAALVLLGLTYCLIIRKWFLPVWFVFIFLAGTGEIGYIVPVVASLLMAIGLVKVIYPSLRYLENKNGMGNIFSCIFVILICIHGIGTAFAYNTAGIHYTNTPVSYDELRNTETNSLSAMSWAKDNTNENSRIFVVGDHDLWWVGDWVPVLTQKTVISVGYGSEWNGNIYDIHEMRDSISGLLEIGDISSSQKIAYEYGTYFTHIFVVKSENTENTIPLLRQNNSAKVVYENDGTVIFEIISIS